MTSRLQGMLGTVIAITLAVTLLLGGQALADASASGSRSNAGDSLGRAGFAYLTGFRVFAAAVLWNRLEPIFHEYYGSTPISEQLHMMPIIDLVVRLDPQFIDSYYVGAWVLAQRGDTSDAFDLAAAGTINNPDSGTLRTSYAQILFLFDGSMDEAVRQADLALQSGRWADEIEQHDAYAILGAVYRGAGETEKAAAVELEIERLDGIIGEALPEGSHDHDGDGVPDH